MDNQNLSIWNDVQETAPSGTKNGRVSGQNITSINGTYMVKRATEQFGPIGKGWGYNILEDVLVDAGPLIHNGEEVCRGMLHTIKLELWYKQGEEQFSVVHYGHTPYIYRSKNGPLVDWEAPKKSLTDAIKKCLSMLGFSADIFLGMYDDQDYRSAMEVKEGIQKAEDTDAAMAEEANNLRDEVEKMAEGYDLAPNGSALKIMHRNNINSIDRKAPAIGMNPQGYKDYVNKAFEKAKKKFMADQPKEHEIVCTNCGIESTGKPGQECEQCGSTETIYK